MVSHIKAGDKVKVIGHKDEIGQLLEIGSEYTVLSVGIEVLERKMVLLELGETKEVCWLNNLEKIS